MHQAVAQAVALGPWGWEAVYAQALDDVLRWFDVPCGGTFRFTTGCTGALGILMNALAWRPGDELVTSGLEHHALARWFLPLSLHRGVAVQVSPYTPGVPFDLDFLENRLGRGKVRLVALSAASSVTGESLPIKEVCDLARAHGAHVLVDGAQVSGVVPVSLKTWGVDAFVFAAHKGMLSPHGLGGLWVKEGVPLELAAAQCQGTGAAACAPEVGFCDVGSVNLEALAGLSAAIGWLEAQAAPVRPGAKAHVEVMAHAIRTYTGCTQVGRPGEGGMPTVAFAGEEALGLGAFLTQTGIKVGVGVHCAPMAHQTLGAPGGTLRLSAGWATTAKEAEVVVERVKAWGEKRLNF